MEKHNVEYILTNSAIGDMHIKAILSQNDLAKLLMRDDVILISVNAQFPAYRRKYNKKK